MRDACDRHTWSNGSTTTRQCRLVANDTLADSTVLMIDASNMNCELRRDPGVCRRAFGVLRFLARADALVKNGGHEKTQIFIENESVNAATTTATFMRIRPFYESVQIILFLQ